jgi:hypothetical protein
LHFRANDTVETVARQIQGTEIKQGALPYNPGFDSASNKMNTGNIS